MRVCKSFRSVIFSSVLVSIFCFISGLIISVKFETPTGASVVCFNIFVFAALSAVKFIGCSRIFVKNGTNKIFSAITVFFFVLIYLVTIFTGSVSVAEKNNKVTVVTTAFAQYDFARNIIGDKGEVIMLLTPGEELIIWVNSSFCYFFI